MAETYKQRLDGFMRDQRNLVKRVGELERSQALWKKRPEDEFWGEEAGRRFAEQQEELVALKEENAALKDLMESGVCGCGAPDREGEKGAANPASHLFVSRVDSTP